MAFSAQPLSLSSLLDQPHLTQLLIASCQHLPHSPSSAPGNQQWACRAVQWMIATVFYHGELAPHRESSKPERRRGRGSSVGAAVGGVLAALFVVAVAVLLVIAGLWWWRRR